MHQAVLALLLFLSLASGQTSTTAISGVIADSTGATVSGAQVTLENEATGVTNRQTTTEAGSYAFPALPAGAYTVTVEMAGFKKARRSRIALEVSTPQVINITLELGELAETVTVESTPDAVETASATLGNVVTQKAIVDLPLNGRNPLTLLTLEPGVVQRSNGGAGTGVHLTARATCRTTSPSTASRPMSLRSTTPPTTFTV